MKTYIWTLPTRVFHSFLVIFTLIAFLSANEDYLLLHSIAGYAIGVLIVFRIIWGFIGPKYSRFKDFNFSIKEALSFIQKQILVKEMKPYAGHNPAASIVLFIIIIIMFFIVFTGILALGEENKGYFKFLNTNIFEDIHELISNSILFFIFLHVSGVLIHHIFHKNDNTLKSIVYGYKNIKSVNDVKLTIIQQLFAFIFLIITLIVMYFTYIGYELLY